MGILSPPSIFFVLKWEGKHITRSKLTIRCVPPQNVIRLFSVDRYLPAPRRYLKLGGARDSYALGRAMGELHQSPGPQSFGFEVDNTMLSLRCFFFHGRFNNGKTEGFVIRNWKIGGLYEAPGN